MINNTEQAILKNWIKIYQDDFSKYFSFFLNWESNGYFEKQTRLQDDKKKLLCGKYKQLFVVSCNMIQEYLIYNGIYQTSVELALKQAYYSEVITDGQKWINLLFLFKGYDGSEKKMKFLLKHINKAYFQIFKNLNEYMKKEIESLYEQ